MNRNEIDPRSLTPLDRDWGEDPPLQAATTTATTAATPLMIMMIMMAIIPKIWRREIPNMHARRSQSLLLRG